MGTGKGNDWRASSVQLRQQGQFAAAADAARKAIDDQPDDAEAWNELGHALRLQGDSVAARDAIERALALAPGLAPAWFNFGAILVAKGELSEGIAAYRKAVALKPDFPQAWSNLGGALAARGELDSGVEAYRKAISFNPELAPVWANLADALRERGDYEEAARACKQAVRIEPAFAGGWNNLGNALLELGETASAGEAFLHAVRLDAKLASAWTNLGVAHVRAGNVADALDAHRQATALAPRNAVCWRNLAQAHIVAAHFDEAVAALEHAVCEAPGHLGLRAALVYELFGICDWKALSAHLPLLAAAAGTAPRGQGERPLANVTRCDEPGVNLAVARNAARDIAAQGRPAHRISRHVGRAERRMTIGYLSSDIHNHATAHLMRGVFERHDRDLFCIHTYSYGPDDGSNYRESIRRTSDVFRDIRELGHGAAADQIAKDNVDILVDLKGWTEGTRLEICALRPARVQVTYLGFPGTSGADFFDYAIVDRVVVPPVEACHYTEQLIYLPHCYQANDDLQPVASEPCSRADHGLPDNSTVLCSFNRSYKLDPMMFAVWMRIMQRVAGAVLWLLPGNRWAEDNLRKAAYEHGIAPGRLVFARPDSKPLHLRRLQLADIALDTRIYNGHTTTSDALWAGVPVVTMSGRHFASRVSASCLQSVGLPELITRSLAQYEELAVSLATDRGRLAALRSKLARNRKSEPLFDTSRFTRNLEEAYRQAWQLHKDGSAAQMIHVTDQGPGR